MRALSGIVVVASGLLVPAAASAHIQLTSPPARYVQNNNGLKTGPCGSGTATAAVTRLTAGQMLTVTWKESVSHAGHYRIALSANQSDFVGPTSLAIPDPAPAWVLVDGISDKTGTQTYSQTVELPRQECRACVLQLIQVMSTGTDGTNTGSFSGVYYACADLDISATGGSDAGADVASATDTRLDLGGGGVVGGRDGAPGRDVGAGGAGVGGNPGRGGASAAGGAGGSGADGAVVGGTAGSGGVLGTRGGGAGAGGALGTGGAGGGAGTTTGMGGSIGAGGMATETGGTMGGTAVGSGGVPSGSQGTAGSGNPPETRNTGVGCGTGGAGPRTSATLSAALSLLALLMGLRRRRGDRSG